MRFNNDNGQILQTLRGPRDHRILILVMHGSKIDGITGPRQQEILAHQTLAIRRSYHGSLELSTLGNGGAGRLEAAKQFNVKR